MNILHARDVLPGSSASSGQHMSKRTCAEVIAPFVQALDARPDLPIVQIIGGNGSAALLHEDTIIDFDARTIVAPAVCDLPRFRPDGSLRDMDTLVMSTDPLEIEQVETLAAEFVGDELKISIFGLKTLDHLEMQRRQPARSSVRTFLGDRYVTTLRDGCGNTSFEGYKALYPFRVPITTETLETFRMVTHEEAFTPTAHPGATILNYLTRSISSVRAKDASKVEQMIENTLTRYPEVREWILDGPGKATFELARILHTLREPRGAPAVRRIGTQLQLEPYTRVELIEHDGFMAATMGTNAQRIIIEMSQLKSHVLGRFESSPTLVTFWQNNVEDRVAAIIHNDS